MTQLNSYEAENLIVTSIGYMLNDDRDELISLLRQNGVTINDNVSNDDLLNMTYVAIGNSIQFRRDLAKYLDAEAKDENSLNYVEEGFFNNDGRRADRIAKRNTNVNLRKSESNPKGKTKSGLLLGQLGTQDNVQAAINTGLGILSSKLTAKADQKSIAAATQLATEKSKQALAEAEAADKKAKAGQATKKWVVPVVIGVSVIALVVGLVIYMRKRKAS